MNLLILAPLGSKYSGLIKANGKPWTEDERRDIEKYLKSKVKTK